MADKVNPFQPSTSPWDQSFTAGGSRGSIVFASAVPPNASPLVPIALQTDLNIIGSNNATIAPGMLTQNLLTYSGELTNVLWTVATATKTANIIKAPDGTSTGLKLMSTAADGNLGHRITELDITSRATFSTHVKYGGIAGATKTAEFGIYDGTLPGWICRAQVQWTAGIVTGMATIGGGGAGYIITYARNGWYRVSGVTNGNVTYTNANYFVMYTVGAGLGAANDYMYVWGPQMEAGLSLSQYGATAASRH